MRPDDRARARAEVRVAALPAPAAAGLGARAVWLATGLAAAAGFVALRSLAPDADPDHALCWLRRTLHVACPTCGMTRALAALARGDWRDALAFHPLAPVIAAEAAWLWARVGAGLLGLAPRFDERGLPRLALANAAALLALWLARLASGTLPA
jgi:hypothetical protein